MTRLLVAGALHPTGEALLERIKTQGVEVTYVTDPAPTAYLPHLPQADALVLRTQPLTAEMIATAPDLRVVSRHGVGYDAVDVAALSARNIALCIVGDVNSISVAEQAMMMMLAGAKQALAAHYATKGAEGFDWHWRNLLRAREVYDKRLLIIGYGRIGRRLARMADAFGMRISAYDPYLSQSGSWPDGPASAVTDLDAALAEADFISVHIPAAKGALLDAAAFAKMKRGVVICNTARGGVVDEAALLEALNNGTVAAAGLDVFQSEPPALDNPLFCDPRVILSPHIGGLSNEAAERMACACVENALNFIEGRIDPALIVNHEAINGR
ncbi:hydroxyacid dehydrogenase [Rhodobacteraceae bacterium XHP0102]|nr:hydroxyacid dehydrogenase [Rhodobacteraceae bacterium XHP0102]